MVRKRTASAFFMLSAVLSGFRQVFAIKAINLTGGGEVIYCEHKRVRGEVMFKKILSILSVVVLMVGSMLLALTACGHEHKMELVEQIEPTCAENGIMEHWRCTSCGKLFADENGVEEITEEQVLIKATENHKYDDYLRCERCGQMVPDFEQIGNVVYHYLDNDNECMVYRYKDAAGVVEIPTFVSGRRVVSFNTGVFEDAHCSMVTIPDGVVSIGNDAFNFSDIESLTLPDSLREVGSHAFSSCKSLSGTVRIPGGLEVMGTHIFSHCSSLKEVIIEDGITEIPAFMFMDCSSLETLTIPASVTSFGQSVFAGCISLRSVYYGGTIAQWESILKRFGWSAGVSECIVYCTDGQI